ncbi:PqqD family peptide modification chaperone [Haloarcula sp. CBA1129]|uniref:PqqD family peptide modification chaperone n=2 Tax=unclassified Haloarcula TaxID=2624677 RepID=UPI001CDA3876|nr:PqqD family peptide modification chaperone [Haloarcula sp. CBA1129]
MSIADICMVAIDSGSAVVATDDCVTTTIDGEVVLLNNKTGRYQGLLGAGPDIWDRIQEPTEPADIVSALVEEYDVDSDRAATDVKRFLDTLAAEQLIKVDASSTP